MSFLGRRGIPNLSFVFQLVALISLWVTPQNAVANPRFKPFYITTHPKEDASTNSQQSDTVPSDSASPKPPEPLISKIEFHNGRLPEFIYAKASGVDPIKECPMESLPKDLNLAVNQLVTKLKSVVADVKTLQGNRCQALADRAQDTKTLMSSAITTQFLNGAVTTAQNAINQNTVQANALNNLISTAAAVVDSNCVGSLTDAVTIQRLIGQVVTLSGFFAGGWQGIGVAGAGTLIGNLPIFRTDTDHTLKMISKYEEINKRGSFLCLYRQMQRTSCLLFAPPGSKVINGFDLTLKSGAPKTTNESLAVLEKEENGSELIHDVTVLKQLVKNSDEFLSSAKPGLFDKPTIESFDKLKQWCRTGGILSSSIDRPEYHPPSIIENILNLYKRCEKIDGWEWNDFFRTKEGMAETIFISYQNLSALVDYYNRLATESDPKERPKVPVLGLPDDVAAGRPQGVLSIHKTRAEQLKAILTTLESKFFFKELKEKIEAFHNPKLGNQERLNYLAVTEHVGNRFAATSFKKFLKLDDQDVSRKRWFSLSQLKRDPIVRRKAISAMISACQLFDPTLACLYGNSPEVDPFFRTWKRYCVGAGSRLCRTVVKRGDMELLIPEKNERNYFRSLCGIKYWQKDVGSY